MGFDPATSVTVSGRAGLEPSQPTGHRRLTACDEPRSEPRPDDFRQRVSDLARLSRVWARVQLTLRRMTGSDGVVERGVWLASTAGGQDTPKVKGVRESTPPMRIALPVAESGKTPTSRAFYFVRVPTSTRNTTSSTTVIFFCRPSHGGLDHLTAQTWATCDSAPR